MLSIREKIIQHILENKKVKGEAIKDIEKNSLNFIEFKEHLLKNDIISEEEILLILSKEYKMPYLDLDKYKVPMENKNLLPEALVHRYKVFPISKIGDVLTLATSNPLDIVALDDLKLATSIRKIDLVLAKEDKIIRAINKLYSETNIEQVFEEDENNIIIDESFVSEGSGLETLVKESNLPPIVRVVDLIIYEALKRQASDIHIEPAESNLNVRYRVDGILHHGLNLPPKNKSAILARLKIMAGLNITEFRVPQDGRFKIKFEGREIDFRVSSLPTHFGEKVVLRVLDKESLSFGLEKLGFSAVPLSLFEEALCAPFGIILVTGPTGSGKSTTLYSIITRFNTPEKNIITIEDPVEYQLEGITQIQVKPGIGLTFAQSLRSVLRQSPDIIMVGEIRDFETADIAIKASLTGQFIFSTLHTNNSAGTITRLIDMGIEPFLVSSSIIASTAQRLVRKLCNKCKTKKPVDKKLLERLQFPMDEIRGGIFVPQGCSLCNNTGYKGRVALLEIISFDDTIREMIIKRTPEENITEYARKKRSFLSLKEDGLKKCLEGITSLEEILRVA